MKHLGLFEGIGGFSLAARWAGWETVAWCEINQFCQKVLSYHFPKADKIEDITKADFTKYANQVDIVTGGFPCQPYSQAGLRKGTDDSRHLWPHMLRAIKEIRPRWVVGENVRGLISWSEGLVFEQVQSDLENEDYEVFTFLLPACAVCAPHERYRTWIVAHRNDSGGEKAIGGIRDWAKAGGCCYDSYTYCEGLEGWVQSRVRGISRQVDAFERRQPGGTHAENGERTFADPNSTRGLQSIYWAESGMFDENIPSWRQFPTQPPLCSRDDGVPGGLAGITFSRHRRESIQALGNAIVPQVAYQIFQAINQC